MREDLRKDMKIVAQELLEFADKNQKEVKEQFSQKMNE